MGHDDIHLAETTFNLSCIYLEDNDNVYKLLLLVKIVQQVLDNHLENNCTKTALVYCNTSNDEDLKIKIL